MRFKNFILNESYLDSARAPIYHWTSGFLLRTILKTRKLGYPTKDGYDPLKGITKFSKELISFTRDNNYRIRGKESNVRFVFDIEKLRQKGYKIKPYVDRSVVKNSLEDYSTLNSHEARFEAEEIVRGPIDLKDGLIKIEVDKKYYDEQKKLIDRYSQDILKQEKIADDITSGKLNFSYDVWLTLDVSKNYDEIGKKNFKEKIEQEKKEKSNWAPKWFTPEKFKSIADFDRRMIKEIEQLLSEVEIIK